MRRSLYLLAALPIVLAASASAISACGGDDSVTIIVIHDDGSTGAIGLNEVPDGGGGDDDDDATVPYTGPTQGGVVDPAERDGSGNYVPGASDLDGDTGVDLTCCNLTFVFDPSKYADTDGGRTVVVPDAGDASADAGDAGDGGDAGHSDAGGTTVIVPPRDVPTAVTVVGDAPPFGTGVSLPMTKVNGVWTATACVPETEYLRYRFYLGQVSEIPGYDAGTQIPLYECDPSQPQTSDGMGGCYNTFGPVTSCSEVDASSGMVTGDH